MEFLNECLVFCRRLCFCHRPVRVFHKKLFFLLCSLLKRSQHFPCRMELVYFYQQVAFSAGGIALWYVVIKIFPMKKVLFHRPKDRNIEKTHMGIGPQDHCKRYNFTNNFNLHYFSASRYKQGVK